MERVRQWVQTFSLLILACSAGAFVYRSVLFEAHAQATPVATKAAPACVVVAPSEPDYDAVDIRTQAQNFLSTYGSREHMIAIPFGRFGNTGSVASVLCAW